jgi:hypothetical protein
MHLGANGIGRIHPEPGHFSETLRGCLMLTKQLRPLAIEARSLLLD